MQENANNFCMASTFAGPTPGRGWRGSGGRRPWRGWQGFSGAAWADLVAEPCEVEPGPSLIAQAMRDAGLDPDWAGKGWMMCETLDSGNDFQPSCIHC